MKESISWHAWEEMGLYFTGQIYLKVLFPRLSHLTLDPLDFSLPILYASQLNFKNHFVNEIFFQFFTSLIFLLIQFEDYRQDLKQVIHGNNTIDGVYITLRMRLRCEILRNGKSMPGKVFDVLNEIVVDRGSNPYLSKIECYEHDHLITKVRKKSCRHELFEIINLMNVRTHTSS